MTNHPPDCRYERLQKIMILSVIKRTPARVKFWFIKNYMSPQVGGEKKSVFFWGEKKRREAKEGRTLGCVAAAG